ncbi:hypothetical protein OH76DRAFT_1420542 [Lentinus brumalis]|uniref:CFEM domain-containing protein n=1 Tax=Lentinus brumalis TaxID=2498619 RepID=A0A371CZV4_9APHY|nr:hypothetical protein OH76DRAFT_1420542 [Polyporus brumalis]
MRFFAVLALAAVASAASLNRRQLPSCANSCLTGADFGSCDPLDDSCLCNSQAFVSSVTDCITGACQGNDLVTAESAAQQLCLAVGVTLTSTPAAPSSTGSGSPSSTTGAPAGSASVTATSTSPAPTSSQTGGSGSNSAASHGVNALAALAAVGAVAFVL